jgi:hypothetical protein
MKSKLPKLNVAKIESFQPCYSPLRFVKSSWKGNAIDILEITDIPPQDRLWVVLRGDCIPIEQKVLFACWCARQAIRDY